MDHDDSLDFLHIELEAIKKLLRNQEGSKGVIEARIACFGLLKEISKKKEMLLKYDYEASSVVRKIPCFRLFEKIALHVVFS